MRTNTGVSENNVFEMDWWEERKFKYQFLKKYIIFWSNYTLPPSYYFSPEISRSI